VCGTLGSRSERYRVLACLCTHPPLPVAWWLLGGGPVAAVCVCARYKNVVQTVRLVVREEGMAGMYGGMAVHLMRTVPNAAIMFMIVEALTDVGV
jgi:solute carrier family 25 protein 33/36